MASTSAITGKFLDVAGKPLTGKITATSPRDYILIPATNVEIYAGNITRGQEIPIKPVTTVVERSTAIGTLLGATEPEPADEHDDVADEPGEVTENPED